MEDKVRIVSLKKIDRAFILQKGFTEASAAKSHLWATNFEAARDACAIKDNLWSVMRAAEVDLWIMFSDENTEVSCFAILDTRPFVDPNF
jgi:hypothetical protein